MRKHFRHTFPATVGLWVALSMVSTLSLAEPAKPTPGAAALTPTNALGGAGLPNTPVTHLEVKDAMGAVGAKVTLYATATTTPAGSPVVPGTFGFSVDGKGVGSCFSPNGTSCQLAFDVDSELKPGTHEIKVTSTGAPRATPGTGKLTVVKAATVLSFDPLPQGAQLVVEGGSPAYLIDTTWVGLKGTVTRATDNKPLFGRAVKLIVDGVLFKTVATNDAGYFFADYTFPPAAASKNYVVEALFDGDELYLPKAGASYTLKRKDKPPADPTGYVFTSSNSITTGQNFAINVILGKTSNGALPPGGGIAGKNIRLGLVGANPNNPSLVTQIAEAKTDANGIAQLVGKSQFAWGAGNFETKVWADGVKDFGTPVNTGHLAIMQGSLKIQVTGPASAKLGETVKLKIAVTDDTTGSVVPGVLLDIPSGQVKTDAMGAAEINYPVNNMPLGTHKVFVKHTSTGPKDAFILSTTAFSFQVMPSTN